MSISQGSPDIDDEFTPEEQAIARAIVRLRELFERAPYLQGESQVPGCGIVTFGDLDVIQKYAEEKFEAGAPSSPDGAATTSSPVCDHLWGSDGNRGSGSAAVITCEKCGVIRKASDSPAWVAEVAPEDTKIKLVYVKRWRTIVSLPEKYADEIVAALRADAAETLDGDVMDPRADAQTTKEPTK